MPNLFDDLRAAAAEGFTEDIEISELLEVYERDPNRFTLRNTVRPRIVAEGPLIRLSLTRDPISPVDVSPGELSTKTTTRALKYPIS